MNGQASGFERSTLLEVGTELVFHTVLVFAVYLLFAGHDHPGGGFIGGLVLGAAFVVRFLATGRPDPLLSRLGAETVAGTGLLLALVPAVGPLLVGDPLLVARTIETQLPLLGSVKASSVLVFELGVMAIVVGVVASVITGLGGAPTGPDPQARGPREHDADEASDRRDRR